MVSNMSMVKMKRMTATRNDHNLSPKEQEARFQEALDHWVHNGDKKSWDEMWFRVIECCRALALKIAPGKQHVEERALDAAATIMKGIKERGLRPEKLSSYCYWPCRGSIQGKAAQHEDQELQLHLEYEEQKQLERSYETVRGIYRPEMDK